MSKGQHRVKGTKVRSYEEAREAVGGPYEDTDRLLSAAEFERLRSRDVSLAAELDTAEAELSSFCEQAGHPVTVERNEGLYDFDAISEGEHLDSGYPRGARRPIVNPKAARINGAGLLLCELAYIRDRLAEGPPSGELLGRVFRLGLLLERWRLKPFNVRAAAGIKVQSGASESGQAAAAPHKARWAQYQAELDAVRARSGLRYTDGCRRVAGKFRVSLKTVTRRTVNRTPRK